MEPQRHTQTIFPLIEMGEEAAIARLLDSDPMLVHARQDDSNPEYPHCWSALQFAASTGQLAVCKLLVERMHPRVEAALRKA